MTRRALVTGAAGFAGRHLCELLVAQGWGVAGIVRTRSVGVRGCEERRADVTDPAAFAALVADVRPDVVFHLAAVVDTVATRDVTELFRINTLGTAAVCDGLRRVDCGARLVFASSAFAYGFPPAPRALREEDPLRPLTPYGASKAAAEVIAAQYGRETGADVVVARAFAHTGPGHAGAYALADWAAQLAEAAIGRGESVLRCGNLDARRDYVDVRDVAAAYVTLAENGRPGAFYNVGTGRAVVMGDILDALIRATGAEVAIERDASRLRAGDELPFFGDVARIAADTGWSARIPLETTVDDLASWALARAAARRGRRAARV